MIFAVTYPAALIAVFLWIGFVAAISFLEAWLKFKAPGITIPLGLGIGRLVFSALNKIEWVLTIIVIISFLLADSALISINYLFYFIPVVVLLLQTTWLLPALDVRAEMLIQNRDIKKSKLHFYFVGMEFIKVVCLFIFGLQLLKL